ncbi:unnamed protein product [Rotaria sp. Silwood2]|nr:unnamed protein product [Rotaria sp. Silwood2]CAF2869389.1 unnamed protein product [Rotaria sp. Silwood2]CAF3174022.1 unnamed protein product [Rotaria sp. Silwood2]CAF4064349.1 unnamed protein product [Rotaria sp. Silwood2]CAF4077184.1 unnamed protein product [Rotaria sp. Silwood2]
MANYYYEAIQFNVSINGTYTIESHTSDMDIIDSLYINSFDPESPFMSVLESNDGGDTERQFVFSTVLETTSQYVLVVITFEALITGPFSIIATGPALSRFPQENK